MAGLLAFVPWSSLEAAEFKVEQVEDGVIVKLDGQLLTHYQIKNGPKPYLWPLVGPTGQAFTRAFPMEKVEGEKQDHPHHRSLWFTHGSVNGIDFWAESPKSGKIVHVEFVKVSGGETAVISTKNDWIAPDGTKVCSDVRTITFRVVNGMYVIDFDIVVYANNGEVIWGDTKEGSFGIRVPTVLDVQQRKGGTIITSEGKRDVAAWGTQARWVDYNGKIDGKQVGIAILNHPKSFRHPTYWHVRDYGLFAANPFGLHDFLKTKEHQGEYRQPPGEELRLNYRVILHTGNEQDAQIEHAYQAYAKEAR